IYSLNRIYLFVYQRHKYNHSFLYQQIIEHKKKTASIYFETASSYVRSIFPIAFPQLQEGLPFFPVIFCPLTGRILVTTLLKK
ncbi:MAG: hypothetical protein PHI48_06630, partial [Bacteroidales bacterium]|nr:hypothetical protein [Bacteroidales bacterium]